MINSEQKGKGIPDIFIVSMSTCSPCIKTKLLLDSHGINYDYVDTDTASQDEWDYVLDLLDDFMSGRGLSKVYPIIIVKGRKMIQGYDKIKLNALVREINSDK